MGSVFKYCMAKETGNKVLISIGLSVFFLLLTGFTIYQFVKVHLLIDKLRSDFYKTVTIDQIDKGLLMQLADMDSYLAHHDKKRLEQYVKSASDNRQEIEDDEKVVRPENRAMFIQLLATQQAYTSFVNRTVIPLTQKGDWSDALIAFHRPDRTSLFEHALNLAQKAQNLRESYALDTFMEMDNQLGSGLWLAFGMGVFLLMVCITAAILLKRAEKRFRTLFENSQDALITLNPETLRVSSGNPAALKLFKVTGEAEFKGLSVLAMSPERQSNGRLSSQRITEMIKIAMDRGSHFFEWTYKRLDGREFPASVLLTRMEIFKRTVVQATVRDITDRKDAEKRINHLNRIYAALVQTNRAIAFCENETDLCNEVCRIVVELGSMKMSWLGRPDESTGLIRPACGFGGNTEYLDLISVSSRADVPDGLSPAGTAFRENKPVVIQDFQSDEGTSRWRDLAAFYDWKSNAAFPVLRGGKPYGVLSVYGDDVNFFSQEILHLLGEMARDLSHALDRFDLATDRQRAVEALAESAAFNRRLVEFTREGVLVWDEEEMITFSNHRAGEIFGYGSEELIGKCLEELHFTEDLASFRSRIAERRKGKTDQFVTRVRHNDGREIWLLISAVPLFDQAGAYQGAFCMFSDITERKAAEEKIEQLAYFDALTGLPNRSLLSERVNQTIATANGGGDPFALLFLDLDNFKDINDALGHRIGDGLLIRLAERIKLFLREAATVFRLGGDEFVVLLPGTDAEAAVLVAEDLLLRIAQPFRIEGYEFTTTASVGIAIHPTDGDNWETLYRCADVAMYEAKRAGRNSFRFFTSQMQYRSERQLLLVSALRHALANGELMLYYQPQVSLKDRKIIGVEALLRWRHPEMGMVPPAEFIPLAEETGLILPIGEWVLQTAIRQAKTWMEAGFPLVTVAVNLSVIQLLQQNLPKRVTQLLADVELPAEYLELEITESVAMSNPEMAASMIHELHKCGIRMVIDDFGTGYSSLGYLRRFQIHKLKIDQSFVRGIASDPGNEAIVDAVISLARSLNFRILAEGVETEQQLHFLREKGCEEIQGYYFSRPLPPDDLLKWMNARISHVC